MFFFFNDTATTEIYTLSLHDALPISDRFDAKRYWRGPTWGMMNALIAIGLADQGHGAEIGRAHV